MAIDFYKEFGELGYLANYSPHGFTVDGVFYPTAEHYYQAHKFSSSDIQNRILLADTPKEASNIGRSRDNVRIDHFKEIKNEVMYHGVLEKFRQNPGIRSKLIETGNQEIRELTEKESYWGVGPNFDGENHMGKILMRVREQVKKEVLNHILSSCKDKKVYVIGHAHPDMDSLVSSLILTHILRSFGIDSVFAVRDESFVDEKLAHDFLKESYEVVMDYSDKNFILVDHNLLSGIPKDKVIGAIDHHMITNEVDDMIEIEYASCALLLYDLFKDAYEFSEEEKELIALSVLSDTEYLTSSRFRREDEKLYQELGVSFDVSSLKKKYFQTSNFSKSIRDVLHDNYKEYNFHGMKVRRSFIASYSNQFDEYYPSYLLEIEKENIDLLIWCDYECQITHVFYRGREFTFPSFTSSTNLILKYMEKEKYL